MRKRNEIMRLKTLDERLDFLRKIEIFKDLDYNIFVKIADNLIEVEIAENEYLFRKGDRGDSIFIVCDGELEARDGEFLIRVFRQGFVLGEFALLSSQLRSASVIAKTKSLLLQLTDRFFFEILMNDITVLQNILKSLVNRILLEEQKNQKLLQAILPKDVADELKEKGAAEPVLHKNVSVLFTDFKGFTQISETMTPQELVKELDGCFSQFDRLTERYHLEKLKTIGDSYMCVGGLPVPKPGKIIGAKNAVDSVLAAMEIQSFMLQMKTVREAQGFPFWELRLGIHSGPLVAGVIGEKKFAYDVWGDTVNTASRMESSGAAGKINISGATYELVKDFFNCGYRGKVNAKNKGELDMYYVYGIRKELSSDSSENSFSSVPNEKFRKLYEEL